MRGGTRIDWHHCPRAAMRRMRVAPPQHAFCDNDSPSHEYGRMSCRPLAHPPAPDRRTRIADGFAGFSHAARTRSQRQRQRQRQRQSQSQSQSQSQRYQAIETTR
ncbi:hypothetical protein GSH07_07975 [Burkholderia pseudomallei]|nr:hypothetical protein [Burkholderia pseudomallei]